MIHTLITSFGYALNGLKTVWKEERNFRIEVICALFVMFTVLYFGFSFEEMIACIIVITLVLSAEIANTAIEDMCNKIEPNQDPLIGKIKDIMSSFVLVTACGAVTVGMFVFAHHFLL